MGVCVISVDATYGNAAALAEGFKEHTDVVTVFFRPDTKDMHLQTEWSNELPGRCYHYVVVGALTLKSCPLWVTRDMTVIWTDTTYMLGSKVFNYEARNANVWVMPDLAHLCTSNQMYYHPFIIPEVDREKKYEICHSPYHKTKLGPKGTKFIKSVCNPTIIMNKTWGDAIKIKAQHKICIDRISEPYRGNLVDGVYTGGVGKSGLEAMFLDTAAISGVKPDRENLPPIVWADRGNLKEKIEYTHNNYESIIKEQRRWAHENMTPGVVAKKILDSI